MLQMFIKLLKHRIDEHILCSIKTKDYVFNNEKNNTSKNKFYAWDPWILRDRESYRLFFLVTKKSDQYVFTQKSVIFSALSKDLIHWTDVGVILRPSLNSTDWDSGRLMAGYTILCKNKYYLYYSGGGQGNQIMNEGIGLAISSDGLKWQKVSNKPIVSLNLKWYYLNKKHGQCRDPYIYIDRKENRYYMLIATEARYKINSIYRGAIGLAVANSPDGPYKMLPPLLTPINPNSGGSYFYEMERPQLIYNQSKYFLFFSCLRDKIDSQLLQKINKKNTKSFLFCYVSKNLLGPYKPINSTGVVNGSNNSDLYGTNFIINDKKSTKWFGYGWVLDKYLLKISKNIVFSTRNNQLSLK